MRSILLASVLLGFLLAACSTTPTTSIQSISVTAEINADQNTATALDIVFVYDASAVAKMPSSGPDWFDKKKALLNMFATGIDVVTLQIPPATSVNVALPKRASKAIAVLSFADYIPTAGQAIGNLTPYKIMQINLTPNNVVYTGY